MKFWQGKFNEGLDDTIGQFISTLSYDKRLYKHDIMGSIAHCTMLGEQGVLSEDETKQIQTALTRIFYDITKGVLQIENATDVFDFLDNELIARIGGVAQKLNIARAKCDRSALALRMYVMELCSELNDELKSAIEALIKISEANYSTVMPSYYHNAKGQPTTLAHALMAFAEMFVRDAERFSAVKKRANVMPLYSVFGTGTRFSVNRRRVAELLKFSSVTQNSLDALTDVDYVEEFISAVTISAKHITSICNALIHWSGKNCGFATVAQAINIDSKSVPQTSEPIVLETLKAKVKKCLVLSARLSVLSENELWYDKSVYEFADTVFEAESIIKNALTVLTAILPSFAFDAQAMLKAATSDFTVARDCVDYLILKGVGQSESYEIVGKICEYCAENNKRLDTLNIEVFQQFSPLFDKDVISAMRVKNAAKLRKHEGEPGEVAVRAEIRAMERKLKKLFPEE